MTKKQRALLAVEALKKEYPDAICSLTYTDPLQLLIATRLSAQCTDARVNLVTPALFERFPTLVSTRFGSRWKFEREGESSEVEVKGRIRTNDTQVILRAALDGLGIALLPDLTISDPVEKGELTTLLPDWKTESVGIYALYASRRYQLPAVRAFIDFLVADIRK